MVRCQVFSYSCMTIWMEDILMTVNVKNDYPFRFGVRCDMLRFSIQVSACIILKLIQCIEEMKRNCRLCQQPVMIFITSSHSQGVSLFFDWLEITSSGFWLVHFKMLFDFIKTLIFDILDCTNQIPADVISKQSNDIIGQTFWYILQEDDYSIRMTLPVDKRDNLFFLFPFHNRPIDF